MPLLKPDLKQILRSINPELEILEHRLMHKISPDSRALSKIVQDIFCAGGKRLRPAISFLTYRALLPLSSSKESSSTLEEKLYLIAEISELIHSASLVHDDIIDNALLRRSMPTMNSKWSNAITVISGDFMFARAAVNLAKLDLNPIVGIYASVLENLCAGEIEQVEHKYDTQVDWDYYYRKSYKKTASLIEASAESVAVLLAVPEIQRKAVSDYACALGMAFQLVDDIFDYTANVETLGKAATSDLKEGQVTIPVLYALETLAEKDSEAHEALCNLINDLKNGIDRGVDIFTYLEQSAAIHKSQNKAQEYIETAKKSLSSIPDSDYKTALLELADFVLSRTN